MSMPSRYARPIFDASRFLTSSGPPAHDRITVETLAAFIDQDAR
jgi:hypothetical protein